MLQIVSAVRGLCEYVSTAEEASLGAAISPLSVERVGNKVSAAGSGERSVLRFDVWMREMRESISRRRYDSLVYPCQYILSVQYCPCSRGG